MWAAERKALMRAFGRHVRTLRWQRRLTEEALAGALGVGIEYVRRIEAGYINIGLVAILHLARALDVEHAELMRFPMPGAEAMRRVG